MESVVGWEFRFGDVYYVKHEFAMISMNSVRVDAARGHATP
jgi:hypothetical protein